MTVHLVQEISIRIHLFRSNKGSQTKANVAITSWQATQYFAPWRSWSSTHSQIGQSVASIRYPSEKEFRSPSGIHTVYLQHIVAHQFWDLIAPFSSCSEHLVWSLCLSVFQYRLIQLVWSVRVCVSIYTDTAHTIDCKVGTLYYMWKRPSTQPQLEESIPRPRSSSLKVVIFKLEGRNYTIIKNRPLQGRTALFVFNYLFYLTTIY